MHVVGTLKKQLCEILLKRNLTDVFIKKLKKKNISILILLTKKVLYPEL